MTTPYGLFPIGSVLRCPITGDLYTRVSDGEERDWLAVYVDSAAMVVRVPKVREDALDLLASSELPAGLVVLAPAGPRPEPSRPVVEVDLTDTIQVLADALVGPLAETAVS